MSRSMMAITLTAVLTACGQQDISSTSGDVLLAQLPSPLPQNVATSQELTMADQVAAATPADPTVVTPMLTASSFKDARVRVWTQDPDDYVTLIAVEFARAPDAVKLVQVELHDLSQGSNTFVTPHAALSGSFVFVIHGATRQGANPVVCEGVWAPVKRYAVETLTCSANGAWAIQAEQLAQQESALVQQVAPS